MLIENNYKSIIYFIKSIKWDLIFIISYAVFASFIDHSPLLSFVIIPLPVSVVIGTMISLLLGFRVSQSYDRWWEARKVWGEIVNDSRTLIRQVLLYIPINNDNKKEALQFAERQIIWCFALAETLRKKRFSKKVQYYLSEQKIEANNTPAFLLLLHSKQLLRCSNENTIDANKQVQIDTTLSKLCDAMGKCERIKNTIFPKNYSHLIHFSIYVFATLLPFGLNDISIALEILITATLPLLLIAIEKTAIIMQDPFEDIPTDVPIISLCETIENNLKEMLGIPYNLKQNNTKYYTN